MKLLLRTWLFATPRGFRTEALIKRSLNQNLAFRRDMSGHGSANPADVLQSLGIRSNPTASSASAEAQQALNVAIVGTGAVANVLASCMIARGARVVAVLARSRERAATLLQNDRSGSSPSQTLPPRRFVQFPTAPSVTSRGTSCTDARPPVHIVVVAMADSILVSPSDRALTSSIREAFPEARLVLHTSGVHGVTALRGAPGIHLALHPAAPFPKRLAGSVQSGFLNGVHAALEGDDDAYHTGVLFAKWLGMVPFRLAGGTESRAVYHAACCMAANFAAASTCAAIEQLHTCATLRPEVAAAVAKSLGLRALEAVQDVAVAGGNPIDALTGPVVRGDLETVQRHLDALAASSSSSGRAALMHEVYRSGSLNLLNLSKGRRLSAAQADKIATALEHQTTSAASEHAEGK